MYELRLHPAVRKDIKRFPKTLIKEIKYEHLPDINHSPHKNPNLKGKYHYFKKYKFFFHNTEYRIIYLIESDVIKVLVISTREEVYKKLKHRFRK